MGAHRRAPIRVAWVALATARRALADLEPARGPAALDNPKKREASTRAVEEAADLAVAAAAIVPAEAMAGAQAGRMVPDRLRMSRQSMAVPILVTLAPMVPSP